MKKKILAIFVVAIFVLLALLTVNVQATEAVDETSTTEDSTSNDLSKLIEQANDGIIQLNAGEYEANNLTIDKEQL